MTNETRKKMIAACEETFNRVAWDLLETQPNKSMSAKEAQDCVADYVEEPGWWHLTYEERHECLAEAIPGDVCM